MNIQILKKKNLRAYQDRKIQQMFNFYTIIHKTHSQRGTINRNPTKIHKPYESSFRKKRTMSHTIKIGIFPKIKDTESDYHLNTTEYIIVLLTNYHIPKITVLHADRPILPYNSRIKQKNELPVLY